MLAYHAQQRQLLEGETSSRFSSAVISLQHSYTTCSTHHLHSNWSGLGVLLSDVHGVWLCMCRSIPAFNPQVATIQKTLENTAFLLRIPQRKPWGNMASDVAVVLKAFDNRDQLLAGESCQEGQNAADAEPSTDCN